MPLNRTFSGVWSVGWDLYAKLLVICDSINHQYNLDVSPANVMGGSGNMLIKNIGNINPSISVSGPILFSSYGYQANLSNTLLSGTSGVLDAYGYSQYITRQCWDVITDTLTSTEFLSGDVVLDSASLSISNDGAKVNTSWFLDYMAENGTSSDGAYGPISGNSYPYPNSTNPPSEGGGTISRGSNPSGELWLTDNYLLHPQNLVPLRKGQWYDFIVKGVSGSNYWYYIIKDFKANIKPEYENFNPIGGYIHPYNNRRYWSVPIKILKGVGVTYDITTLVPVTQGYPGWGKASFNYYTSGNTTSSYGVRVSTQGSDYFNYLTNGDVIVDFLYTGAASGTFPNYGSGLVGKLLLNSSGSEFSSAGYLVKSVSNSLVPGLCEGKASFEFMLRPPSR